MQSNPVTTSAPDPVESVRQFNRIYTRQIGLLEEGLHKSAFSLTEARMLYEMAHRAGLTARDLCGELGLNAGYLSRILKSFDQRGLKVGDAGWIARRQGMLYHEEFGWDHIFEAMVAEILVAYIRNFDARHESAWIAEREGEIVGSVFAVRQSDEVAKRRLLYVEPSARGLGKGARLVDECIAFARERRYKTLTLWTNDILVAARKIYVAAGFKLVEEERHHSFGVDLVGQNGDLAL